MAAQQNKSNRSKSNRQTNRTTGKRKTTGSRKVHNKINEDPNREIYHNEITLIITLVISLLLLLSNFNLSGSFGRVIHGFTFGLFGISAYVLPFLLFFGVAFYIANRGNPIAIRKLVSAVSFGIVITALIQLLSADFSSDTKLGEYYLYSSQTKSGGGIIGGLLCRILYPLFGMAGTYIILIALMIISFMFITGKALITYLSSKSGDSIRQMKERKLRSREYEETEEAEEELQPKRKAKTVLLNKNGTETGNRKTENSGEGFLNSLKKKKTANADTEQKGNFNMEEITSVPAGDIPIQRNGMLSEGTGEDTGTNNYEEQMRVKFGNNAEETASSAVYEERPDIDGDIERLLRAANQDSETPKTAPVVQELSQEAEDGFGEAPGQDSIQDPIKESSAGSKDSAGKESTGLKSSNNSSVLAEDLKIDQKADIMKEYVFPSVNLLSRPKSNSKGMSDRDLKETAMKLQKTLESFGVRVTITNVSCGPSVTRYELQPEQGVKVSKITGLADDIKLNLAAADVRIEAPIPGKAAVGIEVPNKENSMVMFREMIESKDFKQYPSDIAFAVGKDIGGQTIVTDIGKMPHLLIAGATGSGKSVCINTLIMSILYKAKPSDVKMIMVDPKVVELSVYNGIPHLMIPVVTDPKKASAALNWAVMEMTERYKKFADLGVRDVKGYNEKVEKTQDQDEKYQKMPQIVIIVDELADLMMVAPGEVEDAICRLAQMARAAGLHLIIATQRPSVNVITGLIKANIPSRIAFSVSSAIDSRTIIDGSGAEKLLGKGDMLFFPSGYPKPIRVQGAFISDKEVSAVVDFLTAQNSGAEYNEEVANKITNAQTAEASAAGAANDRDEYFIEAGKFIIEKDKASIGMLQRVYKIGFNRAARIMDQLSEAGVVGPEEGTKPRKIIMSKEEFEQYLDEYV